MKWNVFQIEEYPGSLWQDWQTIVDKAHCGNPMLEKSFVKLLVEFYGQDIYVARAMKGEQLTALTLLEKHKRVIWRGFKPSQCQIALYVTLESQDQNLSGLVKAIPGSCLKLDLYAIDPLEQSPLLESIPASGRSEFATNIQTRFNGSFDEYWLQRPKKLRQNISRYDKRVSREVGTPEFHIVTDPEAICDATDRYGMLESQGWKGKNLTALHPGNLQGQFYRNLMLAYAKKNEAAVFEFYLDNMLVASRLTIFSDRMMIALKTTYDETYKKHAIGRLLLHKVIEHLFQKKYTQVIDFYTNATKEQLEWATEQRTMYNGSIFGNSGIAMMVFSLAKIKGWIFNRLRNTRNDG